MLKKLTQSVTTILIVVVAVGTPFLMGRVCSWLGIVAWLDSIWSTEPAWLGGHNRFQSHWDGGVDSRCLLLRHLGGEVGLVLV